MRKRRWARERQEKREDRRPDFNEAVSCLSTVLQGAARRKNGFCERRARGNRYPREGQQLSRPNPNEVGDRTTTLRRLLIGAAQVASRQERTNYLS